VIAPDAPPVEIAPVFISFASKELHLAERVVQQLERAGIRCWIASRDIEAGASYPAAIDRTSTRRRSGRARRGRRRGDGAKLASRARREPCRNRYQDARESQSAHDFVEHFRRNPANVS
jgi:hypothetical protein